MWAHSAVAVQGQPGSGGTASVGLPCPGAVHARRCQSGCSGANDCATGMLRGPQHCSCRLATAKGHNSGGADATGRLSKCACLPVISRLLCSPVALKLQGTHRGAHSVWSALLSCGAEVLIASACAGASVVMTSTNGHSSDVQGAYCRKC